MYSNSSMSAYLDDFGKVVVEVARTFYNGHCDQFYLCNEDGYYKDCIIRGIEERATDVRYWLTIPTDYNFEKEYTLVENHGLQAPLEVRFIVRNPQFEKMFSYSGQDLGATYTPTQTTFVLWAPTATAVDVEIHNYNQVHIVRMKRDTRGVHRVSVEGDFERAKYVYLLHFNGHITRTIDPYGMSATANGQYSAVINPERLVPLTDDRHCGKLRHYTDAIIYEINVRDMTSLSNASTSTHGKYSSLCEQPTYWKGQPTAFSYIKSLGVTHVQLMPVNDFATVDELHPDREYNWGYDPMQYLCPEGSYSSDPNDPYARVNELRQLVSLFHKNGMRVVLDVVYNHMYDVLMSPLHNTVPYYYFRYYDSGNLSNGSGCGNDIDSTKVMMRKLILDATKRWMKMYGIDGFRFDLMGILDVDTMNEVVRVARNINDDAIIYGEGWNMSTYLPDEMKAMKENCHKMPRVGHFNDYFRDTVKGNTSDSRRPDKGYITGGTDMYPHMTAALTSSCVGSMINKIFESPEQSINMVECHDNATSWDKMRDCCKEDEREERVERQKMLIAATLFAQGVPFLHAGQEFCRTKFGQGNTYNAPDSVNGMDYDRMYRHLPVVDFTRACIALRRKYEGFRLFNATDIEKEVSFSQLDNEGMCYIINHEDLRTKTSKLMVVFNPQERGIDVPLEGNWKVILDNSGPVDYEVYGSYFLKGISMLVLIQ